MKIKRYLSLLLCICMILTLMPFIEATANAAGATAITLGTNGISGGGVNWIYYGDYKSAPVKWRVLSTNGNGAYYSIGAKPVFNPLFLMSEYTLDYGLVQFDPDKNTWKDSGAQLWCNNFYNNNFDYMERNAIASTSKLDSKYSSYDRGSLSGDNLFFLSGEEVADSSFGFSSDSKRISFSATSTSNADVWWLRSPHVVASDGIGIVNTSGRQDVDKVYKTWSARPAFNLNSSAILFSSAIGGKSFGTVGAAALTKVLATSPTEWKLTLLDNSRNFDIYESKASVTAGSTITLNYSGATVYNASTAPNEYISAMIVDSSDTVLYYGRLKQPTYSAGTLDITIPYDLKSGSYNLKLFSEQCNATYETDHASSFANVVLNVDSTIPVVTSVSPSGTGASISGNVVINFSEAMNTSVAGTVYLYIDGSSYSSVLTGGSWYNGNTVFTVPYSGLSYNTKYTLLISGFADTTGYSMSSDNSHSFTTTNNTASAYIINSSAGAGGSINPSGSVSVRQGSSQTYMIIPNLGYQIESVLVDGVSVGAVWTYTFRSISASHTIKATFKQIFTDVNYGSWYFNSIINIFNDGLMIGISSGRFNPEGQVTRGMMVTILFNLSNENGVYTNIYSDVSHGSWYENQIAWASSEGITSGVGFNCFAPDNNLTREQLAVMLYNYARIQGYNVQANESILKDYSDAANVSSWAKAALSWAVSTGIITGDGASLNPKGIATRAQVAAIIERYENLG